MIIWKLVAARAKLAGAIKNVGEEEKVSDASENAKGRVFLTKKNAQEVVTAYLLSGPETDASEIAEKGKSQIWVHARRSVEDAPNLSLVPKVAEVADAEDAATEDAEFAMELDERKAHKPSRRLDRLAL